ncbi:Sua5 YciO YrdC YwlC family protein [Helicobacter sp. 12S02634-8]|nr:Sua5 YciO YrdC YwlC family protein [Helicobacter sp. 12S02634-8]
MTHGAIYLAQTDTTAGLLSTDSARLNAIKGRAIDQPVLKEVDSLLTLTNTLRVPAKFKNRVRRATQSTFIYPNHQAFRVIKDVMHLGFLQRFTQMYSTSANKTGKGFVYQEALEMCDVVVWDTRGIFAGKPSRIFQINQSKILPIR